jgi:hypothetical protein
MKLEDISIGNDFLNGIQIAQEIIGKIGIA